MTRCTGIDTSRCAPRPALDDGGARYCDTADACCCADEPCVCTPEGYPPPVVVLYRGRGVSRETLVL